MRLLKENLKPFLFKTWLDYQHEGYVEVFPNPSPADLKKAFDGRSYPILRAALDSNNNIWVWNVDIMHADAERGFTKEGINIKARLTVDFKEKDILVESGKKDLVLSCPWLLRNARGFKVKMSQIVIEALSDDDKKKILNLEGRLLDLKRDMLDAEDNEKEDIKQDIESLKKKIQSIPVSGEN